jgi:hypothetical protein
MADMQWLISRAVQIFPLKAFTTPAEGKSIFAPQGNSP